jgi:hypothetical protein
VSRKSLLGVSVIAVADRALAFNHPSLLLAHVCGPLRAQLLNLGRQGLDGRVKLGLLTNGFGDFPQLYGSNPLVECTKECIERRIRVGSQIVFGGAHLNHNGISNAG